MLLHRDVKITMYQLGHRPRHHYIRFAIVILVMAGLVAGSIIAVRGLLQANTILNQSKAVIKNLPVSNIQMQHVQKDGFAFDVPETWKEQPVRDGTTPLPRTVWQGSIKDDRARWIDVYVDGIPSDLAVNHLLPVEADGDHMNVTDTTSDNCVNFTDKATSSTNAGTSLAKWSGVSFLCDTGNYERDVVAIGSTEGLNTVTLTAPVKGKHRVLLVFTDNSPNRDYTLFALIVKSFRLQ